MGRVPEVFSILEAIGQQRVSDRFSRQLIALQSNKPESAVSSILPTMNCVTPVETLKSGFHVKFWARTQDNPGPVCKGCAHDKSGSVGCVIKNPELKELFSKKQNRRKKGLKRFFT